MRIGLTLDRDATRRESNDYVRALLKAGFRREEIEVLEPGTVPEGEFDGVVLGGGCDVDPGRYGETVRPNSHVETDGDRDRTDFALFERAWRDLVPTLAICRGMQVVNVARGGTLVQDIPTQTPSPVVHEVRDQNKNRRDHVVEVFRGTRLAAITGTGEIPVNSRHHQAVGRLAPGLAISAKAPDGLVEALEGERERWLVAVQWHPENLAGDPPSERLFSEFVSAVRERARARAESSGVPTETAAAD